MKTTRRLFIGLLSTLLVPFRAKAQHKEYPFPDFLTTIPSKPSIVIRQTTPPKSFWVSPASLKIGAVTVHSEKKGIIWPLHKPTLFVSSEDLIITGACRIYPGNPIWEKLYKDEFEALTRRDPIPFNHADWWAAFEANQK